QVRSAAAGVSLLRRRQARRRRTAVARHLALGDLRSHRDRAGTVARGARRGLRRIHGGARTWHRDALARARKPARATMTRECDVAIVGGGIHGVGVAQAAAAAGHRVLLLEKSAIAAGTSSRSSKLIHGGLRYLETGQMRLVRESLHERTALLRLAPGLVRLQPFYIPVYAETRRRPWVLGTGLS